MDLQKNKKTVLNKLSSDNNVINQLKKYCENKFVLDCETIENRFPLQNEPHIQDWKVFLKKNSEKQSFENLQNMLVQFKIPVKKDVSKSEEYKNVVLRGKTFKENFSKKFCLEKPENFKIKFYKHYAGELPVLITEHRPDFENLYRILAYKNEPVEIQNSVNAGLVSGFINWSRLNKYKKEWSADKDSFTIDFGWSAELQKIAKQESWRFKDSIMIINSGNCYSSVSETELPDYINKNEWLNDSTEIRLEHEFTHYACKRIYGKMFLNLFDEIIADCMALTLVYDKFDAELFLLFLGLEKFPEINEKGRVFTYIKDVDKEVQKCLFELIIKAAYGLEKIVNKFYSDNKREYFFLIITQMSLELFANKNNMGIFETIKKRIDLC